MSLKDFETLSKIGEGAYSSVWRVRRASDHKIYALKKVQLQKLKAKEKTNALNEVRILASVNHTNVISYKDAFFDEDSGCLCIVMEYADGGDLYQLISENRKKGTYLSEHYLWSLFIRLTRGLKALHDLNIMHRDLKSANVFLTKDGGVKLGDMNVSKVTKQGMLHTQTGTPYYASPEVWKDTPYDIKSDIWSLGCVMYEAASLRPPFQAEDMKGLYKKVIRGEYPPLPIEFSQDFQLLISQLLQLDPKKRPSCSHILRMHHVLKHIDNNNEEETENDSHLLGTIKFSKDIQLVTERLPKSKYREEGRPNHSEPPPNREFDFNLPKIYKLNRVDSFHSNRRDTKEAISKETNSHKSNLSKNFIRDNYGALKLPRVKYPSQAYPVYSVRQGNIPVKHYELINYLPIPERKRLMGNRNRYS
ncbi:unnamed protein product [Blepharisma stoltei]|uniref:non-specific serine/threonine protein kinase n=1 Tax=Blepharisma stoltei TaxID=1481888 RepID=A0AAU9KBB9_9CILI|nr:unnamed protein product [Blepharisma stoltei]